MSAAFTATLPGGVNPYALNAMIKYNKILCTDAGYNKDTGIFMVSAGMAGNYLVSVTMMSGLVTGYTTLKKNGTPNVYLYTGTPYEMATQTVYMQLAVGDTIWVEMSFKASSLFDVYNTFTAVRIS
ncbi:Hypothetical predicted protein [Mytilus galloprovincialis]|uniref:C1q domain-containing protein n=1 Tax=Mytilus galloprovincialis TaxID=29158 RepID=A0A8B6G548_MYTGA|nr:Hypothetical predicted protein [Mytilus galloprovincialis]